MPRPFARSGAIGAPPPHLYKADTIARFQSSLKEIFLSGDTAMTKRYLNFLVDKIVLTDQAMFVEAKAEAAAK